MTGLETQARLARRLFRRARQRWRYRQMSRDGLPILFANSFPKSGTHLLTQVLQGFTRLGPAVESGLPAVVNFEGESGRPRRQEEILADLDRLLPGDIAYGHLHASPAVVEFLGRDGIAHFFILRDPRDVVVSHVHYVTDMAAAHALHRYYTQELHNFDERLRASILGRRDWSEPFPDVRARFEPYLAWLGRPEVLCLHYEDFSRDREASIRRVLDHAVRRGFPLAIPPDQAVTILADSIDPGRSPTFRRGTVGGWRERFSPEHKRLFKDVAGDLLVRLGYEQGEDW
jgi:hypothetical protein